MKTVILIIVGLYGLTCLIAYLLQSRLVFFPTRTVANTPSGAGLEFEAVSFRNARGNRLSGWWVNPPNARYTVLYCHGNAGNIGDRVGAVAELVRRGLAVFIFDYAGYGESEGRPSELGLYDDAQSAWDYLTDVLEVPPERIIIKGRSLGGAVAIQLATDVMPAGLLLESCFTSLPELGARTYWWLPVRYLSRYRFNSIKKIPRIRVPKLFVHSLQDVVVPYGMGKRLYNKAVRPKTFVRIRGGHSDQYLGAAPEYDEAFPVFLDSLDEYREKRKLMRRG